MVIGVPKLLGVGVFLATKGKQMKMYKVTAFKSDEGACVTWFSSETKAKQFAKKEGGEHPLVEPVEFPSGKKAIIEWLNANCTKGNG